MANVQKREMQNSKTSTNSKIMNTSDGLWLLEDPYISGYTIDKNGVCKKFFKNISGFRVWPPHLSTSYVARWHHLYMKLFERKKEVWNRVFDIFKLAYKRNKLLKPEINNVVTYVEMDKTKDDFIIDFEFFNDFDGPISYRSLILKRNAIWKKSVHFDNKNLNHSCDLFNNENTPRGIPEIDRNLKFMHPDLGEKLNKLIHYYSTIIRRIYVVRLVLIELMKKIIEDKKDYEYQNWITIRIDDASYIFKQEMYGFNRGRLTYGNPELIKDPTETGITISFPNPNKE